MKKKTRAILIDDLDKILNISFNYCRFEENDKIREAAREINKIAYKTMKYVDRYVRKKKKKKR